MKQFTVEIVGMLLDWTEDDNDNTSSTVRATSSTEALWKVFATYLVAQFDLGHSPVALHADYVAETELHADYITTQIADGESSDYVMFRVLNVYDVNIYEIYTKNPATGEGGWKIAWVRTSVDKISSFPDFDCVISINDYPMQRDGKDIVDFPFEVDEHVPAHHWSRSG